MICKPRCDKEDLLPGRTCNCPRSYLALHWTRAFCRVWSYTFRHSIPSFFSLRNSTYLYQSLLRGDSLRSRGGPWLQHLATLLSHSYLERNVTSSYRGSRGWIHYKRSSAVVGWIYYGCTMSSWSLFSQAVAPRRHYHWNSYQSGAIASFRFEPPNFGSWPTNWGDIRLDLYINRRSSWSFHICYFSFIITVIYFISHVDTLESPTDRTTAPLPM